jgi:hypothetical protein
VGAGLRRANVLGGGVLGLLGVVSLVEALRIRDDHKVVAYLGPEGFWRFQEEELKKYLPLATRIGIRK